MLKKKTGAKLVLGIITVFILFVMYVSFVRVFGWIGFYLAMIANLAAVVFLILWSSRSRWVEPAKSGVGSQNI